MKALEMDYINSVLDLKKTSQSINCLPEQIWQSWQVVKLIRLPKNYNKYEAIVVCGMGGSNLFSELVYNIFQNKFKKPLILVRDYNIPSFVDKNTLVVISSYSGNTEETVSCFNQALKQKSKIIVITAGGKLSVLAQKNKLPLVNLETKLNPSNQPRYGLGLQLGSIMKIFDYLNIFKIKESELLDTLNMVKNLDFSPGIPDLKNQAKLLTVKLKNKLPLIIGAQFLQANGHILANQINESAKQLAIPFNLPEINHHLMEGLELPSTVKNKLLVLFLSSNLYQKEIQKRIIVTQKVLQKQAIDFIDYKIISSNQLATALELLSLGSWVSFYLTIINQKNPINIPWVDYFKKELKK